MTDASDPAAVQAEAYLLSRLVALAVLIRVLFLRVRLACSSLSHSDLVELHSFAVILGL